MTNDKPLSLAAYAATAHHANIRRCLLCTVPSDIEEQVRKGKTAGITYRTIGTWLESVIDPALNPDGKPIGKSRLERHFQDEHRRVSA